MVKTRTNSSCMQEHRSERITVPIIKTLFFHSAFTDIVHTSFGCYCFCFLGHFNFGRFYKNNCLFKAKLLIGKNFYGNEISHILVVLGSIRILFFTRLAKKIKNNLFFVLLFHLCILELYFIPCFQERTQVFYL